MRKPAGTTLLEGFLKTHPKPPFHLDLKQLGVARDVYYARHINDNIEQEKAEYARTKVGANMFHKSSPAKIASMEDFAKRDISLFN